MFKVNHLKVILNETPVTWEWHYPIRSALWLTPILFICKIFYFIGIYPFINVQLLLRIFTATLSAYAESKFLDFTYRMFQIFEISSNYFIFIILAPVANRPISQTNLGLPGRRTVTWTGRKYNIYSFSRPITNTIESALFTLAISTYKIEAKKGKLFKNEFSSTTVDQMDSLVQWLLVFTVNWFRSITKPQHFD